METTGELPYKVCLAGANRFTGQNNTIRQLMATVCLYRYAELIDSAELRECARLNLRYNLSRFYREMDGIGVIAFSGSGKLGASPMAALAIYEQEGTSGPHQRSLAMLRQGIDRLWNSDGSIQTFHFPESRNDNQNFYPGEALCFWARLLADDCEPNLHQRFLKSFTYFREFHRDAPNPAFIPWHTQAYALMHGVTGNPELAEFILEMNDWLLSLQQTAAKCSDFVGRFYDPKRREFGPPHAELSLNLGDGLKDQAAAVWAWQSSVVATSSPSVNFTP